MERTCRTEEAFDNGQVSIKVFAQVMSDADRPRRWLRTGDEVKFDKDGNIFIVDRIKVCRSLHPSPHPSHASDPLVVPNRSSSK